MERRNCKVIPVWITEKDVAKITAISLSKLRSDRFYGRGIPYSKIGKSVRYSLSNVEEFMQKHSVSCQQ